MAVSRPVGADVSSRGLGIEVASDEVADRDRARMRAAAVSARGGARGAVVIGVVTVTVAVRAQWGIVGARRRVRRGMQHGCLSSLGFGLAGANGPVEDFEVVGGLGYADRSNRTDDAAPWPMC